MSNLQHCAAYLQRQHVLTLCCHHNQQAWAASCFYQFDAERISCYLMTEPTTRHGQLMLANPLVTGTVSEQIADVSQLQGVQFIGEIQPVTESHLVTALASYQTRFPIARQKSAPLWELRLLELKMTDNRLGFGQKITWSRTAE